MSSTASFSNDPNVLDATAIQFSRALQIAAQGHALWHPSLIAERGGVEGDCGYFDGGRFQALFSVYEPPDDLELPSMPRPRGRDKIVDEIPNQNDIIRSSDSCSVQVAANLQLPPLPQLPLLTIDMSAERAEEEESAAFLAFCGPKRVEHRDPRTRGFENYLVEHGDLIVAHYCQLYPVDANNLVIIYQTTRCVSWWSGITYRRVSSAQGQVGAQVRGVGAAAHVEVKRTQNRPWMTRRGPESWEEQCQPQYSIIMRVVAMKKRSLMRRLARTLRMPAPHKADGSRSPPEDKPRRSQASFPNDRNFAPIPWSTARNYTAHHLALSSGFGPSSSELEDSSNDLVAEQHDLLDEALENVLRDNPDVDVAVGNWDVVLACAFTSESSEDPGLFRSTPSSLFVSRENTSHGVLGRLVGSTATKSDGQSASMPSFGSTKMAGRTTNPIAEAYKDNLDTIKSIFRTETALLVNPRLGFSSNTRRSSHRVGQVIPTLPPPTPSGRFLPKVIDQPKALEVKPQTHDGNAAKQTPRIKSAAEAIQSTSSRRTVNTHPLPRRALPNPHDHPVRPTQLAKVDQVLQGLDITDAKASSMLNQKRTTEGKIQVDDAYMATERPRIALDALYRLQASMKLESVRRLSKAHEQPAGREDGMENQEYQAPRTVDEDRKAPLTRKHLEIPSQEDARVPMFWAQIEDCQTLIDFFIKLLDERAAAGSEAVRPQVKDGTDVNKSEVKPPFEPPFAAQRNKGETESGHYVGAKSKKKGGNGKKLSGTATEPVQTAPKLPVSGEQPTNLIVPHEFRSKLLLLSIPPPTSYDGILQTLNELKMATKRFEAAHRRQTEYEVAKKAATDSSFNLRAQPPGGRLSIL